MSRQPVKVGTPDIPVSLDENFHNIEKNFRELYGRVAVDYADLRTLDGVPGATVIVSGRHSCGDNCGGVFVFDPSDLSASVSKDTLSGVYVAPDSDPTGSSGAWVRQHNGVLNVAWFGAKGDGVEDDWAAFDAACNWTLRDDGGWLKYGGQVHIPEPSSHYRLSQTLNIKRVISLCGKASGTSSLVPVKLVFDPGNTGVIINRYNTLGSGIEESPSGGADASLIEGISIMSGGGETGHGLQLRARAVVRDIRVVGFPQDGIHIVAAAGGDVDVEGNANNFSLANIRSTNNGGHGLFVDRADANAGVVIGLDCSSNGGWGIYDSSFLGNTYIGCHAAFNVMGPYKSDNANARNAFVNCYSESGQPESEIMAPAMVVGGLHGAGISSSSTAFHIRSGTKLGVLSSFTVGASNDSTRPFSTTLSRVKDEALTIEVDGDGPGGWAICCDDGNLHYRHRRLDSRTPITITTDLNTINPGRTSALPGGKVVFGQGVWIGATSETSRLVSAGTAPPVSGEFAQGDIFFNCSPVSGGHVGWVCVDGGEPGTWKGFGSISE